jgi:acyl carrier protein
MNERNELAATLRHFITENFLFGVESDFADDDSLLQRGIVDSTGVLELISFLETTFAVTVADDELAPENLDSIANLVRFIAAKRQPAAATA